MPFDDTNPHNSGGGGDGGRPEHRDLHEFVESLRDVSVLSCSVNDMCIGCSMWHLGTRLLAEWLVIHVSDLVKEIHDQNKKLTHAEALDSVDNEVADMLTSIRKKFEVIYDKHKNEQKT